MSEIIKPAAVLCVITLIAAICLGVAYGATKEPIAREKQKAQANAMQEVLPDAEKFESTLEIPDDETGKNIVSLVVGYSDEGAKNITGYVIGVAPKGYSGSVEMMVGVDSSGEVRGVSILKHSETPGLGANADSALFTSQYIGKQGTLTVTKSEPKDNEIEAITSATITTQTVTKGVNDALAFFRSHLQEAGS